MTDVDWLALTNALIRFVNMCLWLVVTYKLFVREAAVRLNTRRILCMVVGTGMMVLFIGSLTQFGFPGELARLIYTAYTAAAAIVAIGLLAEID